MQMHINILTCTNRFILALSPIRPGQCACVYACACTHAYTHTYNSHTNTVFWEHRNIQKSNCAKPSSLGNISSIVYKMGKKNWYF